MPVLREHDAVLIVMAIGAALASDRARGEVMEVLHENDVEDAAKGMSGLLAGIKEGDRVKIAAALRGVGVNVGEGQGCWEALLATVGTQAIERWIGASRAKISAVGVWSKDRYESVLREELRKLEGRLEKVQAQAGKAASQEVAQEKAQEGKAAQRPHGQVRG